MTNKVGIRGKGAVFQSVYKDDYYRVGYKFALNNFYINSNAKVKPRDKPPLQYQTKDNDGKWKDIKYEDLPNYVQDELLKREI